MHRKLGSHYFKLIISLKFWVTKIWNIVSKTGFITSPCWLIICTHEERSGCKCTTMQAYIKAWKVHLVGLGFFGNRSKLSDVTFCKKLFSSCQLPSNVMQSPKSNSLKTLHRFSILNSWHIGILYIKVTIATYHKYSSTTGLLFMMVSPKVLGFASHILSEPWCIVFFLVEQFVLFRNWEACSKVVLSNQKKSYNMIKKGWTNRHVR